MRKIVYIFQLFSVMLLLGACEREELKTSFDSEEGIPFSLELTNKTVNSRAAYYTEAGVTGYNENVINRADVFFYTDQAANAVHKVSYTWDAPQEQKATLSGTIPANLLENAASLYAYAIVNGPATPEVATDTDTKIATLKQIEIDADFTTYTAATTEKSAYSQDEFVMDGENTLTISDDKKKLSGTIQLNRAASKIALFITNLEPFTDGDQNIWYPQEREISVSFHYGVETSRIDVGTSGNDLASENYYHLSESSSNTEAYNKRFSFAKASADNKETTNIDESKAYTHFPFYSYSSDWGLADKPDQEAYLSLRVYWKKGENGTPEAYYYRIPINVEDYTTDDGTTFPAKQLQRNTYYKVLLEVGVLGEKSEQKPLTLTPNYIVVNWNDEPIKVQLADYHYLVVEKNFVEMFNQENVTVGYEACENVTAEIVYLARPNFTANTITTNVYHGSETNYENNLSFNGTTGTSRVSAPTTKNLTTLLYDCSVSLDATNKQVTLNHQIQNDNDGTNDTGGYYDCAIYTIVVRLTTDCGLTEYVEIKQYPARYIEGERDVNENYTNYGTVYINGYNGINNKKGDGWYYTNNTLKDESGSNSNPNMYVITITSFDETQSKFIIADPRVTEIDNIATTGWTSAPALYGTTPRTLTYYYPTREDNPNYIAPKFRTAAAYGRLSGGNVDNLNEVHRRCAAYQEYGYPAGRWRVPTAAELEYLGKLCSDGVIPALFNNETTYNSANGAYKYNSGSFTSATGIGKSVRCVYDEWYWENKCDVYTFTWGDQPR